MNWSNLLRFRKQVEEMVREEVILAQWERSREALKRDTLREELHRMAYELDRSLKNGVGTVFAQQRLQWVEEMRTALDTQDGRLQDLDRKLEGLREKLKKTHHARRVVEIVIAKKEAAILQKLEKQEQRLMEEVAVHQYVASNSGEC